MQQVRSGRGEASPLTHASIPRWAEQRDPRRASGDLRLPHKEKVTADAPDWLRSRDCPFAKNTDPQSHLPDTRQRCVWERGRWRRCARRPWGPGGEWMKAPPVTLRISQEEK